jgi:glycosyltransferase involved in cell wall biosynthesis
MKADRSPVHALFLHRDLLLSGGVPRSFLYFQRHADPGRIRVSVASFLEATTDALQTFNEAGMSPYVLGDRQLLRAAWRLRRLLAKTDVNVVVTTTFRAYVCAKLATAASPIPVVFWIPAIPLIIEGRVRRSAFRLLARKDTLVFVSEAVRTAHHYAGHRGRWATVYYGVDDIGEQRPVLYSRHDRAHFGLSPESFVLGYVASFIAWKDHRTLLLAFEQLLAGHPDLELMLIGEGDLRAEIERIAASSTAPHRIHLLGARPDARQLLSLMDVYVHPSRGEGLGLAVVEAMSAGLPVLAANEGALPEYVFHGDTGLLFQAGDAHDLATNVECLIDDETLRRRLGDQGRQHCLQVFAPERFSVKLTSVLEATARQ